MVGVSVWRGRVGSPTPRYHTTVRREVGTSSLSKVPGSNTRPRCRSGTQRAALLEAATTLTGSVPEALFAMRCQGGRGHGLRLPRCERFRAALGPAAIRSRQPVTCDLGWRRTLSRLNNSRQSAACSRRQPTDTLLVLASDFVPNRHPNVQDHRLRMPVLERSRLGTPAFGNVPRSRRTRDAVVQRAL